MCGRSYSFVPVYSENAPERLPCDEFLLGVLSRAGRYLKLIVSWTVVILFNAFCNSLHPLGQQVVADSQRVLAYLWVGLLYSSVIACSILIVSIVRMDVGVGGLPGWFLADGDGLQGGVLHFLWKYLKILCDWYYLKLILFLLQRLRRRVILVPPLESLLDEFGVFRRLLFFFDDHVFAVSLFLHFSTSLITITLSTHFCLFSPGPCHQRICLYTIYSSAIFYWMGCISNCWRRQQLFVWKLACYSWIHDDAVNLLCLLWNPLHSPTKLTFSHRSLAFSGVSLHNSDIAMSLVGFLSNGLQKHITHQGCFCLVLQVWCSALDSWLVPRNLHLPYVWNQEFSDT